MVKKNRLPFRKDLARVKAANESSPFCSSMMPSYSGVDRINLSASTMDSTMSNNNNNNNHITGNELKGQNLDKMVNMTHGSGSSATSNLMTMMHILKGNIGTGILAMPSAFKNSGLIVGTIGVPIMGVIAIHCMHMLVKCQEFLSYDISRQKVLARQISKDSMISDKDVDGDNNVEVEFLDYEDVAEEALKHGPGALRNWSGFVRKSVIVFLLITQIGFCCVYSLFVGDSIKEIIENVTLLKNGAKTTIAEGWCMLLILPFMIAINQVKSLKHLSYASTIANVLQMTGLALIFVDLLQDLPSTDSVPASSGISHLPLFFGTAIYAFEGIGIVLPIKKGMAQPDSFGGVIGVLNTSMIIVASLYTGMGFFGYLKYGENVVGSITLNLTPGALNECIRGAFAMAIFLSYALQMYVPVNIIWPWIVNMFQLDQTSKKTNIINFAFRAIFVSATFLIAIAVPKLDLFISLVGAFSSSCLALIFPPLFDFLVFWNSRTGTGKKIWIAKNSFICIFGILGFLTGTYASVLEVVKFFNDKK